MLDPAIPTPAMALANSIGELQAARPGSRGVIDPLMVSAYINASLFAFATMAPLFMASVRKEPIALYSFLPSCLPVLAMNPGPEKIAGTFVWLGLAADFIPELRPSIPRSTGVKGCKANPWKV
jgi:hypothetical protein